MTATNCEYPDPINILLDGAIHVFYPEELHVHKNLVTTKQTLSTALTNRLQKLYVETHSAKRQSVLNDTVIVIQGHKAILDGINITQFYQSWCDVELRFRVISDIELICG